MLYKTLFVQHYYTLFWSGTITAIYWHDGVALLVRRNGIFTPSYAYDKVNIDTYIFNIIYTICNQPRNIDKDEIMPLNSN